MTKSCWSWLSWRFVSLLSEYEFPVTTLRWCMVSALKALRVIADAADKIHGVDGGVDEYIPMPERDLDKPFLMPIEDVFSITGRGTVVTGKVEQGIVHTGDEIEIVGIRDTQKTTCTGVEMFRKLLDEGQAGDNIGALLRGTKGGRGARSGAGKPGSITPHTNFEAQVYVLTRTRVVVTSRSSTIIVRSSYFRTTDVTGTLSCLGYGDGDAW